MCSCMKLAGNFLVLICSVSSVLWSSPARLPTYCYGYHLDKYNPVLAAPASLWVFPADIFLSITFFSLFPASPQPFPQPVSKTFMIALHLLLWGCSLQFPASPQKASSLLKPQWNWVFVHFPLPWLRQSAWNCSRLLLQGISAVLAAAAPPELIPSPSGNHSWVIFQHLAQLSCPAGNAHPEIPMNLLFPSLPAVLWRAPGVQRAGGSPQSLEGCGSRVWHSALQSCCREIHQKIIRAQGSELEILRAGFPGRFAAFQASNPFSSGGAASQKRKEKLRAAWPEKICSPAWGPKMWRQQRFGSALPGFDFWFHLYCSAPPGPELAMDVENYQNPLKTQEKKSFPNVLVSNFYWLQVRHYFILARGLCVADEVSASSQALMKNFFIYFYISHKKWMFIGFRSHNSLH